MATNIFDTRHVMNQIPKMSNRFLLTADVTTIRDIVNGNNSFGTTAANTVVTQPISKLKKLNQLAGGNDSVFGEETKPGKSTATVLDLSLLSCMIPAFEFETAEVNRFNDSVKHITKFSASNDMSAVYYDYINGSAAAIMLAWQSAVGFKLTGEIGYKKKYTCDMDLYVYGPNRSSYPVFKSATTSGATGTAAGGEQTTDSAEYELLMQFKIKNAFPRSVDLGDFSYDSAEVRKVTVQFGYDMIIPYKNKIKDINNTMGITEADLQAICGTSTEASASRTSILADTNNVKLKSTIYIKSKIADPTLATPTPPPPATITTG
jgi:hypothetical protein